MDTTTIIPRKIYDGAENLFVPEREGRKILPRDKSMVFQRLLTRCSFQAPDNSRNIAGHEDIKSLERILITSG